MLHELGGFIRSDMLSRTGGCFAILVMVHFTIDWVFQSHDEAMEKSRDWVVRFKHCAVYTSPFVFVMAASTWPLLPCLGACGLLFVSHFVEDTYLPVLWWAKYVRKPPQMRRKVMWRRGAWGIEENEDGDVRPWRTTAEQNAVREAAGRASSPAEKKRRLRKAQAMLDLDGFIAFVGDPLGKILLIAIDQIVHLLFLIPVAYMLARQP